jgi:hypothetical protein
MAGAGIRSFAKFHSQMPRIATTGITSWQTAVKWTADCQVPRSCCRSQVKPVAIRSQIHTSVCGNPRAMSQIATIRGTHLSAKLRKRLNSSSGHFTSTSRVHLFEASYLFAARLLEYKIPTRRIVLASVVSVDTHFS